MPTVTKAVVVNRLLERLLPKAAERILGECETVSLLFGSILCEPQTPFEYVYFPLTSFISLVAAVEDHAPLEMGLIGNEGMLGATLILGVKEAPLRGVVQGPGTALRMTVKRFHAHLGRSAPLRGILNRYLYVLTAQLSQTSICTRFHAIEARLSRWLLMTHDRAHADHFRLTHTFLAGMLGVQRSAVTIAAGHLQGRGLIRYSRGEIIILDRRGLEGASCGCYEAVMADYRQLLG